MMEAYVHFFCAQNFGDDAFVLLLAKRYPQIKFHIHGERKFLNAFQNVDHIQVHYDSKWKKALRRILEKIAGNDALFLFRARNCPVVITIGGSIFIQPEPERLESYYRYKRNQRIPGKTSMILGANFGPYTQPSFLEFFRKELAQYDFVSFRDMDSYTLFQELPQAQVAPDILFGIRALCDKPDSQRQKPYVVFSLIDMARNRQEYEESIREMISFYHKQGMEIVLLSLCEAQGDLALCRKMQQTLPFAVECVNYTGDVLAVISCIANADYVIASRFHTIVTALAYHVPVLPVSYSNKTKHMLEDIRFPGMVVDIDAIQAVSPEKADANRLQGAYTLPDNLAQDAQRHFKLLDRICIEEKDTLA